MPTATRPPEARSRKPAAELRTPRRATQPEASDAARQRGARVAYDEIIAIVDEAIGATN
jgi:hypothetical protein